MLTCDDKCSKIEAGTEDKCSEDVRGEYSSAKYTMKK